MLLGCWLEGDLHCCNVSCGDVSWKVVVVEKEALVSLLSIVYNAKGGLHCWERSCDLLHFQMPSRPWCCEVNYIKKGVVK